MHPGRVAAKKIMLREKSLGRRVILVAGHDEPVQRPTIAPARREQPQVSDDDDEAEGTVTSAN